MTCKGSINAGAILPSRLNMWCSRSWSRWELLITDLCAGTAVTSDLDVLNDWTGLSGEKSAAGAKMFYRSKY